MLEKLYGKKIERQRKEFGMIYMRDLVHTKFRNKNEEEILSIINRDAFETEWLLTRKEQQECLSEIKKFF